MAYVPYGNGNDVALATSGLRGKRDFAQRIGLIISTFAMIESELPRLFAKITGATEADAEAIVGVFRAFSNRIDLLEQVIANRPPDAIETKVFTYFKGLFKEANTIRNTFAHAHYGYLGGKTVRVVPYGNMSKAEEMTIEQIQLKIDRLEKIAGQLSDFTNQDNIPGALHAELSLLPGA